MLAAERWRLPTSPPMAMEADAPHIQPSTPPQDPEGRIPGHALARIHSETYGQSAPIFGLAHLLGIELMPRIRSWRDLHLFRPDVDTRPVTWDQRCGDRHDYRPTGLTGSKPLARMAAAASGDDKKWTKARASSF